MTLIRKFLPLLFPALACLPLSTNAQENVMLVLDASGSMWGQIDGVSKVEIARDAVGALVKDWEPENQLGLIAYGHNRKGDCDDIETLIPVGPLDAKAFEARVRRLNALGMTPLSAAVIKGAEALKHTEQKATVILISDGEETCKLDPCAVGKQLEQAGVDFTAHVIGFDIANLEHQAQLRCLAENTGGRYLNARDAAELTNAVNAVVAVATEEPLPSATATLKAPASALQASEITVEWEGPGDEGDYIAIYSLARPGAYTSYAYVKPKSKSVKLLVPSDLGDYEIRYVSERRKPRDLAKLALKVTPVEASLEAPDEVSIGTEVSVRATGPHDKGHWIGLAPKGSAPGAYVSFAYTTGEVSEVRLKVPSEPGDYELRYLLANATSVLVSRPLKVVESAITVSGPTEISATESFSVKARGPEGGHWLGIAKAGSAPGAYLAYQYLKDGVEDYTLRAPAEAGDYELRVILVNPERIAASQAIQVIPPQISIQAPESVKAGEQFEFTASGPSNTELWLSLAKSGSEDRAYLTYEYVNQTGSYRFDAPAVPGDYELRFMLSNTLVGARKAIRVTE